MMNYAANRTTYGATDATS